jgi:hypothetical protein
MLEIVFALRQRQDRVHVVGKHHPGVDAERGEGANAPNRAAKVSSAVRQQTRPTVGKVDGKKNNSHRRSAGGDSPASDASSL